MEDSEKAIVTFEYTNYEGKTAIRKVRPYQLLFTSNAYYKTPQWLLLGFDIDKKAMRSFSMEKIKNWQEVSRKDA